LIILKEYGICICARFIVSLAVLGARFFLLFLAFVAVVFLIPGENRAILRIAILHRAFVVIESLLLLIAGEISRRRPILLFPSSFVIVVGDGRLVLAIVVNRSIEAILRAAAFAGGVEAEVNLDLVELNPVNGQW